MISTEDIERFRERGYLLVHDVVPSATIEHVHREFQADLKGLLLAGNEPMMTLANGLPCSFMAALPFVTASVETPERLLARLDITLPHAPWSVITNDDDLHVGPGLLELVRNREVLDIVEQLIGGEIACSPNAHSRFKLPATTAGNPKNGAGVGTMWHQDAVTQVESSDDTEVVTVWIPMANVTPEHGCLLVVPGWHRHPSLLAWPLPDRVVRGLEDSAVPLPAQVGDIVLLHKRTPHASMPNTSQALRWSFDLRYYPTDEPSDRPFFPSIVVRSSGRYRETTEADEWHRMWLAARDKLVSDRRPLPGRREYARAHAEQIMASWSDSSMR